MAKSNDLIENTKKEMEKVSDPPIFKRFLLTSVGTKKEASSIDTIRALEEIIYSAIAKETSISALGWADSCSFFVCI